MKRFDYEGSEMVKAILEESGLTETAQILIKGLYEKQQEIIYSLENMINQEKYRQQYIERRLDELLMKIDPEEAEKRKSNPKSEASAGLRLPSRGLI